MSKPLSFEDMLINVGMIFKYYPDKKDRKKQFLSLMKRCTTGGRIFIQSDILGAPEPRKTYREVTERYLLIADISREFDRSGAQGLLICGKEIYPVYINPDSRGSLEYAIHHEEEVVAELSHEFCMKYEIPHGTKAVISLFITAGFSGHEWTVTLYNNKRIFKLP